MILLATRTFLFLLLSLVAGPGAESPDGAQLFQAHCYSCHHSGSGYAAPTLDQLQGERVGERVSGTCEKIEFGPLIDHVTY
jgi:mono/diheme cytochrome c family protein